MRIYSRIEPVGKGTVLVPFLGCYSKRTASRIVGKGTVLVLFIGCYSKRIASRIVGKGTVLVPFIGCYSKRIASRIVGKGTVLVPFLGRKGMPALRERRMAATDLRVVHGTIPLAHEEGHKIGALPYGFYEKHHLGRGSLKRRSEPVSRVLS